MARLPAPRGQLTLTAPGDTMTTAPDRTRRRSRTDPGTRTGARRLTAALVSALATAGLGLTAAPAIADTTVTLTGVVVGEDGSTDTRAEVQVSPEGGGSVQRTPVAADGSFTLSGMEPGRYHVSAGDTRTGADVVFTGESWNGTTSDPRFHGAVDLAAGTTQIRFELDYAQGVLATAVDASGAPLPGIALYFEEYDAASDRWIGPRSDTPVTDAQGRALLRTARDVPYRVCFRDVNYSLQNRPTFRYAQACWNGATEASGATPITLGAQDRKVGITIPMTLAGRSLRHGYPFVHGTPQIGATLTAEPTAWGPVPVTLAYRWGYYDDQDFVAIPGAVAATFTPTADLAGRSLHVEITGTAPGHVTPPPVTAPAGVVGGSTPTAAGLRLTGATTAGSTVTAHVDSPVPATSNVELRWYADGELLVDAFGPTLAITPALAGKAVGARARVYDFTFGQVSSYENELTLFTQLPGVLNPGAVTVTGTPAAGQTLTAAPGTWGPGTVTLGYQWTRNGTAIPGATRATYTAVAADGGAQLAVAVTGTRDRYAPVTARSAAVAVPRTVVAGTPTIQGLAQPRSTVTASPGTWGPSGVSLSYRWYRNGVAVPGATGSSLALTSKDVGTSITVAVTGSIPGAAPITVVSRARIVSDGRTLPYPGGPGPSLT